MTPFAGSQRLSEAFVRYWCVRHIVSLHGQLIRTVVSNCRAGGRPTFQTERQKPAAQQYGRFRFGNRGAGIRNGDRSILKWLLAQCLSTKAKAEAADKIEAVITDEAMVFLSGKLSTPLQFETYLTRSFEEGYRVGQKPVTVEVIESILAKDIDELEPRLTPARLQREGAGRGPQRKAA